MATRSTIGILRSDRSASVVYCHSDGYPSYNGKRLHENYATMKKVSALVREGSMSVLGEKIGVKHDFDWRRDEKLRDDDGYPDYEKVNADPRSKMCMFYKRDRGEKGVDGVNTSRFDETHSEAYTYLFCQDRNEWLVSYWLQDCGMTWRRLSDVMALEDPDDYEAAMETLGSVELYPQNAEDTAIEEAQEALTMFA